ncbi:viperin family antiviral radical SAM protein [Candidatus Haliotispira prima]|uniref:S-adenosylmethionine-dependent nucleotide dehydratase n=1 Tax=Candidatus Haliotispira prima TaxID=3034016 RepID=A0ABY8MHF0_9SPIO|nr:viperin family antiviral radical SAM protein [Candidatus Haliotispira prima]
MTNVYLPKPFPQCPFCWGCNGNHKKSYPSKQIALEQAAVSERKRDCRLHVYPCRWQSLVYHLTKSRPEIPPNYQGGYGEETYPIGSEKIEKIKWDFDSGIRNIDRLCNIDGEVVLNWHVLETCNFACKYCYAEWGNVPPLNRESSKQLLEEIAQLGKSLGKPIRLSFAGGEPLLDPYLGFKIETACDLGLSVSLITNGYDLSEEFMRTHARRLDVIGISIDSFDDTANQEIGRAMDTELLSVKDLKAVLKLGKEINNDLKVKVNTVVNRYNWKQDMRKEIADFGVDKWKILRVLGSTAKSKLEEILDAQFKGFCERHKNVVNVRDVKIEDNSLMKHSYLMINPGGCFFSNSETKFEKQEDYLYSESILKVGIFKALEQISFDDKSYQGRY